jgi:hypothetical protein
MAIRSGSSVSAGDLTPLELCRGCCNTWACFLRVIILKSHCKLSPIFCLKFLLAFAHITFFHAAPGVFTQPRPISHSPIHPSTLPLRIPKSNNPVDRVSTRGRRKSTRGYSVEAYIFRSSLSGFGEPRLVFQSDRGETLGGEKLILGSELREINRDTVSALGITKLPNLPFASAIGYVRYFRQALSLDER